MSCFAVLADEEPCTDCNHEERRLKGERYWWFCGQPDFNLLRECEEMGK
jgi:hypothetical protein